MTIHKKFAGLCFTHDIAGVAGIAVTAGITRVALAGFITRRALVEETCLNLCRGCLQNERHCKRSEAAEKRFSHQNSPLRNICPCGTTVPYSCGIGGARKGLFPYRLPIGFRLVSFLEFLRIAAESKNLAGLGKSVQVNMSSVIRRLHHRRKAYNEDGHSR
jgi:hypothetical protein